MTKQSVLAWLGCALAVLVLAGPAASQVTYNVDPKNSTDATPVPDVDKNGVPGAVPKNDYGCWAATAANLLGAAGWGIAGTAQQKADQIYQDFITNFKVNPGDTYLKAGGSCPAAIKWWVHNIGLNPAYAGSGYSPTVNYVNFRCVNRTLNESDYNFLLDELVRCQYASVFWILPGEDLGHCMTLVGGNYGPHYAFANPPPPPPPPPPHQSVWHNSDNDGPGGVADEVYAHEWDAVADPVWYLDMSAQANHVGDWIADGYVTICPGVPKPANAIGNFDVHYYRGIGALVQPPGGPDYYDTMLDLLTTGSMRGTYQGPAGEADAFWDPADAQGLTLILPNQVEANKHKEIYILVDFNIPLAQQIAPIIQVIDGTDENNVATLTGTQWASDNGQVLLTYAFDDQPAWEKIIFPSNAYTTLSVNGNIFEWNIATLCIPEPAVMSLLAAGAWLLILRRRRG